jgi:3-phenylpropionate/trans-cinnamate dioxygenase ferredoxin subunit
MKEQECTWHKISDSLQELLFPENGLIEVEIAGKKICLSLHQGLLHACAALCPHAGGRMINGYTDATGNIVCPTHRYKFNLKTGRNTSGEGYYLRTYPVQIREDGVFIGFESSNLFKWFK